MEEVEIWKDIPDYPNYQVSNLGNVKSLNYNHTGKEGLLKQGKQKNGYLSVFLYKDVKGKTFYVHKLVAMVFLENPYNYPCVNHKDENKENNCLNNLEWVSYQYNNTYNNIHKKRGLKTGKTRKKPILQYTLSGDFIKEFDSATTANIELKISQENICMCCKGKIKSAYGFIWKYKE